MNRFILPLLALAAIALPAHAADDHAPKHGGIVIETKAGDLELVAKADSIVVHARDHGKPMKLITQGILAVICATFPGARKGTFSCLPLWSYDAAS